MKDISNIYDARIKNILNKVENKMLELFQNKLQDIILYGSYARNENTSESDMDIMILVDEKQELLKKYEDSVEDIMVDLSLEYDIVLSLYTQSIQEYQKQISILPFLRNIQSEGIRIYG
jgi:predicted nucleotidyltransferase